MSTPVRRRTRRDDHSTDGEHADNLSGVQTRSRAASSGASEDERDHGDTDHASETEPQLEEFFDEAPESADDGDGDEDEVAPPPADNAAEDEPHPPPPRVDAGPPGGAPPGAGDESDVAGVDPVVPPPRDAAVAPHREENPDVRRREVRPAVRRRVQIASPHRAATHRNARRVEGRRRVVYEEEDYSDYEPEVRIERPRVVRIVRRERHDAGPEGDGEVRRRAPVARDAPPQPKPRTMAPRTRVIKHAPPGRLAAAGDGRHVVSEDDVGYVELTEGEEEHIEEEQREYNRRPGSRRVADIKLPTFDGEGWLAFKHQFEAACCANDYSQIQKCSRLKCVLRGAASAVLGTIGAHQWSYKQLLDALEARYGRVKSENDVSNEMFAKSKGPNQTAHAFADELIALANQAEVKSSVVESMTYLAFKNGLRTAPAMQSWVSRKHTKPTLRNCVEWAAVYERERGRESAPPVQATPWSHLDACSVRRTDTVSEVSFPSEVEISNVAAATVGVPTKPSVTGKIETMLEKINARLDDVAQQQTKLRNQYDADKKGRVNTRPSGNNRGGGNFNNAGRGRGGPGNYQPRRNGNFNRRGGYSNNQNYGGYQNRGNRDNGDYQSGGNDRDQGSGSGSAGGNYSQADAGTNHQNAQDGRMGSSA